MTDTPPPTLEEAARFSRVRYNIYAKQKSKGAEPVLHFYAWEPGESVAVHTRDESEMVSILGAWNNSRHLNIPLVVFAGRRGCNVKCMPRERKTYGSRVITATSP